MDLESVGLTKLGYSKNLDIIYVQTSVLHYASLHGAHDLPTEYSKLDSVVSQ